MLSGVSAIHGPVSAGTEAEATCAREEQHSHHWRALCPFSWTCPQVFPPILQVQSAAYLRQVGCESNEI